MLRLQISLLLFISNGMAKTKLAILAFLCCGEFVKTSSRTITCTHPQRFYRRYTIQIVYFKGT